MQVHQLRSTDGTGTLSYLLVDESTRSAAIIDPNSEDLSRIQELVKELSATVVAFIETHTHVDHISATNDLKQIYSAPLYMHENTKNKWKVVDQGEKFGIGDILRANAKLEVDVYVNDNDTITVGNEKVKVLHTPGHTDNHISLLAGDDLFTGDLLLIGQAGRSDLPGGSPDEQFDSFQTKILPLPDATRIWPGHDYEENTFALLRDERKSNPFLTIGDKKEYAAFVADFFPPLAEATASGEKMTVQCGTKRVVAQSKEPFHDIDPDMLEELIANTPDLFLLDVREPFELSAFGAIENVVNIPTRQLMARLKELPQDKNAPIVTICQSGSRSYEVAHYLSQQGYTAVYNLDGGTSQWVYSGKKYSSGAMKVSR